MGQLGYGDREARGDEPGEMGDALPPVDLGAGRAALALETGGGHACAILDDHSVKCWGWNSLGWTGTLLMTALVIGLNLAAGVAWQRVRETPDRMRSLQRAGVAVLSLWFLVGGWWGFRFYLQSPELAREPYRFLNAARIRKGLAPTPDGLARDPEEVQREALRRKVWLPPEDLERVRAR